MEKLYFNSQTSWDVFLWCAQGPSGGSSLAILDSYFGKMMILILAQQLCKFSVSTPSTKVNLIGRIKNKIVLVFTNISWPLTTISNQQLTHYIQTDSTAVTLHELKKLLT